MNVLHVTTLIISLWLAFIFVLIVFNHKFTRYRKWKLEELEEFELHGQQQNARQNQEAHPS